jgi:hypothetical protein
MKSGLLAGLLLVAVGLPAFSQGVENDDMYFNASDRAKLKEQRTTSQVAYSAAKENKIKEAEEELNPTDSYSARNVNPEYAARSNSKLAQEDNQDYFVNNYRYQSASNFNNFNNTFSNWYGSSWYSSNYWGPSIYQWNSPYYGSYYDSWGNPWHNPYYQSNYSSAFSYHWGNNYNYAWGNSFSYGCPAYNSFWGPSSFFGPSSYFGYAYGPWGQSYYGGRNYGYGGYPSQVVVVENNPYKAYGRRNSRSSNIGTDYSTGNGRTSSSSAYTTPTTGRSRSESGRVNTTNTAPTTRPEYYERTWRNQPSRSSGTDSRTSTYSTPNSNNNSNTRSSWSNGNSDSNNGGSSRPTYTPPSRSSSSSSGDSGSRSTGSSSGGGGGHSRSRGR